MCFERNLFQHNHVCCRSSSPRTDATLEPDPTPCSTSHPSYTQQAATAFPSSEPPAIVCSNSYSHTPSICPTAYYPHPTPHNSHKQVSATPANKNPNIQVQRGFKHTLLDWGKSLHLLGCGNM